MRIMVTGGAGFFGRPVVRKLQERGHEVSVIRSRDYDLRDKMGIAGAIVDHSPEVIVHLAARVGGIGANAAAPAEFLYENAVMGLHLMDTAYRYGVKKFVTIGTVCEYPEHAKIPFREDELWDGYPTPVTAPYGLAKKLLLAQAQAYRKQYGFDSIHLIPVNLYGPEDNFDLESGHVVPALIRKLSTATHEGLDEVTLWGTGLASREFIFIEDAAEGVILATERYSGESPVNIGTGDEITIEYIATAIGSLYGFKGRFVWDASRPDGQPRRAMDVSLAEREFGFRATTPLLEGLAKTITWYEDQRD